MKTKRHIGRWGKKGKKPHTYRGKERRRFRSKGTRRRPRRDTFVGGTSVSNIQNVLVFAILVFSIMTTSAFRLPGFVRFPATATAQRNLLPVSSSSSSPPPPHLENHHPIASMNVLRKFQDSIVNIQNTVQALEKEKIETLLNGLLQDNLTRFIMTLLYDGLKQFRSVRDEEGNLRLRMTMQDIAKLNIIIAAVKMHLHHLKIIEKKVSAGVNIEINVNQIISLFDNPFALPQILKIVIHCLNIYYDNNGENFICDEKSFADENERVIEDIHDENLRLYARQKETFKLLLLKDNSGKKNTNKFRRTIAAPMRLIKSQFSALANMVGRMIIMNDITMQVAIVLGRILGKRKEAVSVGLLRKFLSHTGSSIVGSIVEKFQVSEMTTAEKKLVCLFISKTVLESVQKSFLQGPDNKNLGDTIVNAGILITPEILEKATVLLQEYPAMNQREFTRKMSAIMSNEDIDAGMKLLEDHKNEMFYNKHDLERDFHEMAAAAATTRKKS